MKKVKNSINQIEIDGNIFEMQYEDENLIVFETVNNNNMNANENYQQINVITEKK